MDSGQPTGFNIPPEQFILPERATVRDPQGSQYVIEKVVRKGASGIIYLVRERDQKQRVFALKEVINPDQDERKRFAFEADVLRRLDLLTPGVYIREQFQSRRRETTCL